MGALQSAGQKISTGFGNIAGDLGMGGGAAGTNFAGPTTQNPNITAPLTPGQLGAANTTGVNTAASQQALLQALQSQGGAWNSQQGALQGQTGAAAGYGPGTAGLGYQNMAMSGQQGLNASLGNANGLQNTQNAVTGLNGIAGQQGQTLAQLQGIANGTGPNPAQAMLNQQTGQNVANQAALMAGQRGAGANVGLLARQAGQQGAATQQQAVGQGATLQAQQQLGAIGQMGQQQNNMANVQGQIAGIGGQQLGAQQQGLNNLYGQGAGLAGQQQSALGQQANMAQGLGAQQIAGQQAATTAALQEQQNQLAAQGAYNTAQSGLQGNVNTNNQALAQTQMGNQKGAFGSLASSLPVVGSSLGGLFGGGAAGGAGASTAGMTDIGAGGLGAILAAKGGVVPKMADGGSPVPMPMNQIQVGPSSEFGRYLSGVQNSPGTNSPNIKLNQINTDSPLYSKGGKVHNLEEGGKVIPRSADEMARKKGNSFDNDRVPALLSAGEMVIPREVMQGQDPVRGAADFVAKHLAKKGRQYG